MKRKRLDNFFTLSATSAEYVPNGEGGGKHATGLFSYWKQVDMTDVGKPVEKLDDNEMAKRICETIATVAKRELVTGQAKVEHFCFLRLTKAPRHECDEGRAADRIWKFRLEPVQTKAIDGRNNIPLYVATYELLAVQAA
ncbi:hypothetical protein JG688_00004985 [Phytophthora aleatoria]|uniref:Uncharacterized protein n=1 Tax=Phytophthora aleatoria TaxID=2496075 RepID=A0A8J5J8R4_9STRA|nr:hypothetical protein JG688_00004985 [Phytophthora aleatoria]